MPRDVDIGVATPSPRSTNDYGVIGWLKKISGYLSGLALGTAGTPAGGVQSVQGVDGGEALTITTPSAVSVVSFSRTADTAIYNTNDVIGINNAGSPGSAVHTFLAVAPTAGGEVLITSAALEIDLNAVTSGMTSFRLYLYDVTPPSALVDNNAWDLPSGDRAAFKGYIDLGTPVDLGSTLYVEANAINKQISVASGGSLFGYLVTNGAYTPASGTVYKITLHAITI